MESTAADYGSLLVHIVVCVGFALTTWVGSLLLGRVGRHTGVTLFVTGLVHFAGELHAKGVRFVSEPTQMPWGIMAMIADPDGNILALWEDEVPES